MCGLSNRLIPIPKIVSPLRYPGGKGRLSEFIFDTLQLNSLKPSLFVEPFAGSASVSISLLIAGCVDKIALGDKDPFIADFWKIVVQDSNWLINKIRKTNVSLDTWRKYKYGKFKSARARAFACLFLNRTSFSGIIAPGAGPIGGHTQLSEYKIDCRFPKETIIGRIQAIQKVKESIVFVQEGDWKKTIEKAEKHFPRDEIVYYMDPPFFHKSQRLYRKYFQPNEHKQLKEYLSKLKSSWILSYDNASEIKDLYSKNGSRLIERAYSIARSDKQIRTRELIISNLKFLPD